MDNQISVEWDTITGVFDRSPVFPIMLIDAEILERQRRLDVVGINSLKAGKAGVFSSATEIQVLHSVTYQW